MIWQIYFWLLVVLLLVPFPFKLIDYATGKDKSPLLVKIEEMAFALFTAIGLLALYGLITDQVYLSPLFWQIWLLIAVVWSISPIFWLAKLAYATEILGKSRMRIFAAFSCLLYLPLLLAVYFYAF